MFCLLYSFPQPGFPVTQKEHGDSHGDLKIYELCPVMAHPMFQSLEPAILGWPTPFLLEEQDSITQIYSHSWEMSLCVCGHLSSASI